MEVKKVKNFALLRISDMFCAPVISDRYTTLGGHKNSQNVINFFFIKSNRNILNIIQGNIKHEYSICINCFWNYK